MSAVISAVFDLIYRDPVIIVMVMILLIAYFADAIDRW